MLARCVNINANSYGRLYTKVDDIEGFENIETLIEKYNKSLYIKHQGRRLEVLGKNLHIKNHVDDTKYIIQQLLSLANEGIEDYKDSVEDWIQDNPYVIDSDEKRDILKEMFENSIVSMIYGAAGTGKSTLIKYVSQFWGESTKVYLANTNPAVENLRRKIDTINSEFMTIKKFLFSNSTNRKYDILFIDECSMVSNRDMVQILKKANFELLVLVGDVYQIESIQFGNWFSLARYFVPKKIQHELTKPYRTNNENLLTLWDKVRNYEDDVTEHLVSYAYTSVLDESIFEATEEDEIVLCLNYDGLYGINNINRFLQGANPNTSVPLGIWIYKVGDPVLFNESTKYASVLYNNLKGRIVNIEDLNEEIFFSIEIDKVLNRLQISGMELELMPKINSRKSIVRFSVKKRKIGDDDGDERDSEKNVPFQIAYAVSIHKAQGLEYDSVKIVITKEVDEMITHNIFYT